jgi:hypothetical protein
MFRGRQTSWFYSARGRNENIILKLQILPKGGSSWRWANSEKLSGERLTPIAFERAGEVGPRAHLKKLSTMSSLESKWSKEFTQVCFLAYLFCTAFMIVVGN